MALTSVFHVTGPYKIEMLTGVNGASWIELGQMDNEDLAALDVEDMAHEMKTVSQGDEVADAVYIGSEGKLTFTCAKFVQASVALLMAAPGTTTEGLAGTIGVQYSTDGASGSYWRGFRIVPVDAAGDNAVSASRPMYTMPRTFFRRGDTRRFERFGNEERRLVVQATVIRGASNVLYARSTSNP